MYKVMVIDDEKYIRKSIRNRIDWERFGITEIEEAGTGREALERLETFCPQIVLVDIRMPLMDGLTFIKEAKKKYPEIDYVIMSAYSDFSYARTAIGLGVEAYLLKPIDEEEMEKLLNRLLRRINEKRLSRMSRSIRVAELNQESILRFHYVTALALYTEKEELGARLETAVRGETEKYTDCFVYHLRDCSRSNCYVFLFNMEDESQEAARCCGEAVLGSMGEWEMRAGVSKPFGRGDFKQAVNQSICFLKRKIFSPEKKIIVYSFWEYQEYAVKMERMREGMEQIYSQIKKGEFDCVKDELLEMTDGLLQENNPVALMEDGIDEILILLRHLPKEANSDLDFKILFHDFRSKDYLLVYHTAEELRENLKSLISRLLDVVRARTGEDAIANIKNYIERNYGDPLNAAELAQKYGLNVSYLSTLFKERAGINLVSYIEGIRMEKAKNMLKNRKWTITEVAIHTGYSNSNYFSKVFKKYTGVTPREFRESERKKE